MTRFSVEAGRNLRQFVAKKSGDPAPWVRELIDHPRGGPIIPVKAPAEAEVVVKPVTFAQWLDEKNARAASEKSAVIKSH